MKRVAVYVRKENETEHTRVGETNVRPGSDRREKFPGEQGAVETTLIRAELTSKVTISDAELDKYFMQWEG